MSPGPGAYQLGTEIGKGPKKSMGGGKYREKVPLGDTPLSPGPAQYDTRPSKNSSPGYSIKGRPQTGGGVSSTPGPGNYALPTSVGAGVPKYSLGGGKPGREFGGGGPKNTPGPGTYGRPGDTKKKSPAYSLRGRTSSVGDKTPVPGPGAYGAPISPTGSPNYSLGGGKGHVLDMFTGVSPGPGAYAPSSSTGKKHEPAFTIRPRTSDGVHHDMAPGPGAYSPPTSVGTGQKKSMGGGKYREKVPLGDTPLSPGPAQYDTRPSKNSSPGYSIKGRPQTGGGVSSTPGPGNYALPTSVGAGVPKYSLGGGKPGREFGGGGPKNTPGPGTYGRPGDTKKKSPAYSLRGRTSSVGDKTPVPGPGAYGAPISPTGSPNYSLAGRHGSSLDNAEAKKMPGPGAYSPSPTKGKSYSFGGGLDRSLV